MPKITFCAAAQVTLGLTAWLVAVPSQAQTSLLPADLPVTHYHLTARPWSPLNIPDSAFLDRTSAVTTYLATLQNADGDIIDPYLTTTRNDFQFAFSVARLAHAGKAKGALLAQGIKTVERGTSVYATTNGWPGGTFSGSDFWIQPLVDAIHLLETTPGVVTSDQVKTWYSRMKANFGYHHPGNWAVYQMRGEWHQNLRGLLPHAQVVSDIEKNWAASNVYNPIAYPQSDSRWSLWHDNSSSPDTLAVETAGRSNLLALSYEGYDGPSAPYFTRVARNGTQTSLLLQDPSGQAPTTGRTDDHVWIDAGYGLCFDIMAATSSDPWTAGQYRRAANLAFQNINRWATPSGFYYVTKNYFPPSQQVGYQGASSIGAYDGNVALITGQQYNIRIHNPVAETPAPVEIGGYAMSLDNGFHTAFANAGGTAMEINLQGQTTASSGKIWSTLGVVRLGRVGWDTRLGPSDGITTMQGNGNAAVGISFAPTWNAGGGWTHLGSYPGRYQGTFTTTLATPVLVRASVTWAPTGGNTGPTFVQDFTVTPDGILSQTTETAGNVPFGMTYPLMQDFGAGALSRNVDGGNQIASVTGPNGDTENFIDLNADTTLTSESSFQSSYGNIMPVRAVATGAQHATFVYPGNPSDPSASSVKSGFQLFPGGFSSPLGRVTGSLYVGRTSAGGYGSGIDTAQDNNLDVTFSAPCNFVVQLSNGVVKAVEVDRPVTAIIQGNPSVDLQAYTPLTF